MKNQIFEDIDYNYILKKSEDKPSIEDIIKSKSNSLDDKVWAI